MRNQNTHFLHWLGSRAISIVLTIIFACIAFFPTQPAFAAVAAPERPNILVIFGDDIGWFNTSAYNDGIMGYRTPNIDRIAEEGVRFTDYYGENSCTAGRAAFITGQSPYRTGLLKVGLPGADLGLRDEDPTLAELLKPLGYATGQFGKNHLGDRDEFLPTNHGFDEFFGNLYHLNAEEEPENYDYPTEDKYPNFKEKFGPRGVLHSYANGPIEDTGPLTKKRMETVDEEFLGSALDFIEDAHDRDQPFFVWFNTTRMHVFTHLKPESVGVTGLGVEADGMVEHDGTVGQLLNKLDELGITDNTIVVYTTDNGAELFTWPDGGMTPFKGEKDTTWEGGFRVPAMVRWPGHFPAGEVSNAIMSAQDWLPTLMAAVGEPNIKEKLLEGYQAGDKTFKVHLDGYNFLPALTGEKDYGPYDDGPRKEMYFFEDGGELSALRYRNWKIMFAEQRGEGFHVWAEPFVALRWPRVINLRMDPFERAATEDGIMGYTQWATERMFVLVPAQAFVKDFLQTFAEFPPRQKAASFSIDQVLEKLEVEAGKH